MVARKPPFILAKCLCLSGLEACPVAFALLKTPPHPLPKCAFGPFLGWQNEGYVRPLWSRISVWRDGSGKPRPTTSSADRYGLPGTATIHDRRGCVLVGDGIEPADHCGGRIGLASARSHRAIAYRMVTLTSLTSDNSIIEPCRPWLSWVGLHCLWGVDGRLSVRVLDTFGP